MQNTITCFMLDNSDIQVQLKLLGSLLQTKVDFCGFLILVCIWYTVSAVSKSLSGVEKWTVYLWDFTFWEYTFCCGCIAVQLFKNNFKQFTFLVMDITCKSSKHVRSLIYFPYIFSSATYLRHRTSGDKYCLHKLKLDCLSINLWTAVTVCWK